MVKGLTRRKFIQQMLVGSLSAPILLENLTLELRADEKQEKQSIIWLQGQSSGIHRSGIFSLPGFNEFIDKHFDVISVDVPEIESVAIDFSDESRKHLLILDGYFSNDPDDPINNLLKDLIVISRAVILLGNEAAYSSNKPDGFLNLESELLHLVETLYIKLPGHPVPARHLLGVLNHLIFYESLPEFDEYKRPSMFYSKKICDRCEYRGDFENGHFVRHYGHREGCLYLLGCKGPITKNSCPVEKWNGTSSWCVGVGSPCTGCSEPDFPNHHGLGIYGQLSSNTAAINSFFVRNAAFIAQGALAITATGIVLHAISRKTAAPIKDQTFYNFEDDEE